MADPRLKARNIERIMALNLCHYCGICIGACPIDNVVRQRSTLQGFDFRVVDPGRCGKCTLCLDICPGEELDMPQLHMSLFGKPPQDPLLGNYLGTYLAHAKDSETRGKGASGGVITALVAYALSRGLADGALVVRDGSKHALEPESFIATTPEELHQAAKSKYYPVPLMEGLKQVIRTQGRFVVVGLPCHLHGLRKYEEIKRSLRDKVVLQIGLFCGFGTDFPAMEFVASRVGIRDMSQVRQIIFRDGDWPGNITVVKRDDTRVRIPGAERDMVSMTFMPSRCATCMDSTGELADLAVGDAWLPEVIGRKDHLWTAVVMTRTQRGSDLLRAAIDEGVIEAKETSGDKIVESQKGLLAYKKRGMKARMQVYRLLGQKVPSYRLPLLDSTPLDYAGAVVLFLVHKLASSRRLRKVVNYLPSVLVYYFGYGLRNLLQMHDFRRRFTGKVRAMLVRRPA